MMMQDIAMHVLDIGMNSIIAKASEIYIDLNENSDGKFIFQIRDNGKGMNALQMSAALDPFYTTRTTRKVGLGLSFLKAACELCEGTFSLQSVEHQGTEIEALFQVNHWDCPPMGDLGEALVSLMVYDESIRFLITIQYHNEVFVLDTSEVVQELDGVAMSEPSVMAWLKQFINEQIMYLKTKGGEEA